jgi:FkbH-like protein
MPRVAQLTQKTNQFNLSLRRRSLDEIRSLSRDADVFVVSASDRFGDYGLIGVVILKSGESSERLEVDTFLLSCRALGRSLEQLILQEVVNLASQRGLTAINAPFETGARNQPVRDFFDASGLQKQDSAYVGNTLNFDVLDSVNWMFSDCNDSFDTMADVA